MTESWEARFRSIEERLSQDTTLLPTAQSTPVSQLIERATEIVVPDTPEDRRPHSPGPPVLEPQTQSAHGIQDTQDLPSARVAPPPIPAHKLDVNSDTASVISGPELSRNEKWNSAVAAIKELLPNMPATAPTPAKRRRLPDPADPEPRESTVRLPLHKDIREACTLTMQEARKALEANKKPQLRPDRPAPARFFRPEGAGHFMEPAEVEQAFKDLNQRQPLSTPYQATCSEADVIEREKNIRTLICIRSARKWIDESIMITAKALESTEGMEEWGRSLRELLTITESLAILELDRFIAEFSSIIMARREMWLRALHPTPHPALLNDLKAASLLTQGLFGDLPHSVVDAEKKRRMESGILDALQEKVKAKPGPKPQAPEPKQPDKPAASQPRHRSKNKGRKGQASQSFPQPQQQQQQQPQQHQQWKGRGAKPVSPPAGSLKYMSNNWSYKVVGFSLYLMWHTHSCFHMVLCYR